jgi:hypothetical protein
VLGRGQLVLCIVTVGPGLCQGPFRFLGHTPNCELLAQSPFFR